MKPKTPNKHAYYLKALAAGWKIEGRNHPDSKWYETPYPNSWECRVVPDEDGWLPWFGDGECPVGPGAILDTANISLTTRYATACRAWELDWKHSFSYRIHKEEKKEEPIKSYGQIAKTGYNMDKKQTKQNEEIEALKLMIAEYEHACKIAKIDPIGSFAYNYAKGIILSFEKNNAH